jgi:hypothetical protein
LNRLDQAPLAPSRYHKIGHDGGAIEGADRFQLALSGREGDLDAVEADGAVGPNRR